MQGFFFNIIWYPSSIIYISEWIVVVH